MDLNQYISTINKCYQSGISREHAYRADLEALIRTLVADVEITSYPTDEDNMVTRKVTKTSLSYQPAQKWLKARSSRKLSYDDFFITKKSLLPSTKQLESCKKLIGLI